MDAPPPQNPIPVIPTIQDPIPLDKWKPPRPPKPAPMQVTYPNARFTILAKDPLPLYKNTATLKTEPPVLIECPASIYDWAGLFHDLVDDTSASQGGDIHLECQVSYRARVVNKLLEWIVHYTTSPEPNEWTPETIREMRKTRNLTKKPKFEQCYETEKSIAETLPEWDRTVWFPLKMRLDEDGDEENVFVMNSADKGLFFEVLRLADQLRIDKLYNHLQKLYTLAFIRGRIPEEIEEEDQFYSGDEAYWDAVYPLIQEPEKTHGDEPHYPHPEKSEV